MNVKLAQLCEIFEIIHGNKLDLNKMSVTSPTGDSIAFIGRSGGKNGVVAFVEKLDTIQPYPAGMITVALGGSALSSFVQPRPFYTAQNIDVLTASLIMSLDVKFYYCLCIEANRFRYSTYGREANRTLKHIEVPVPQCIPSWVRGISAKSIRELCLELTELVTPCNR